MILILVFGAGLALGGAFGMLAVSLCVIAREDTPPPEL